MAEKALKKTEEESGDEESGLSLRSLFRDAVIYATRKATTNALRLVLTEEVGVKQVNVAEDDQTCRQHLTDKPKAALIIDWGLTPTVVVPLLKAAQADPLTVRPVLLLANQVTPEIVAIALEYRVARIAMGQVTASSLPGHLQQVLKSIIAESVLSPVLAGPPAAEGEAPVPRTPAQVIEALEAAHERYPNNFRITVELAERLIEQEEWVKAEMLLHPLWTLDPPYLRALSAYSRCLMKKNAFSDAEFVLKKGKLINPHEPDRLVELGDVLLHLGNPAEARQNYDEARVLDADHKGASMGQAKCKLLEEDINEALAILQQASSPRELASVFNTAAIISAREKRFEHSLALYKAAGQAVVDDVKTLARLKFNEGVAYVKWGRMKDALASFEEGARLDPKFKKAAHNVAVIKNGDSDCLDVDDELTSETENIAEEVIEKR